jgi:hypothetical protein
VRLRKGPERKRPAPAAAPEDGDKLAEKAARGEFFDEEASR